MTPSPASDSDAVANLIASIADNLKRADAERLLALMQRATGASAYLYAAKIVGFGSYNYRYPSGTSGSSLRVGFSPRSSNFALYGLKSVPGADALRGQLGKHSEGAGCLYVKRLSDVDEGVLGELIALSFSATREHELPEA